MSKRYMLVLGCFFLMAGLIAAWKLMRDGYDLAMVVAAVASIVATSAFFVGTYRLK